MRGKHFLTVRDFTVDEIGEIFKLALKMKAQPDRFAEGLRGKTLALIFEKPSLRTRVSFDVGIQQLGGFSVYLTSDEIKLGVRESVYDIVKNLERLVQGIMIRTFAHQTAVDMASVSSIPIINGLTDFCHPCQAMADYLTIQEQKGNLRGLRLAYIGDGNNVAHSLMFAGAKLGVNVAVACPKSFEPNLVVYRHAIEDAKESGAEIEVGHQPTEIIKNADIVYTDVWASMGQEGEAKKRRHIFMPYQINDVLMERAKSDAIFMHCLPAHRGEEVTDSVIDSAQSVVYQQAENRLHAQKAIMYLLMK
jgi:ornithine carbamoyltransferase